MECPNCGAYNPEDRTQCWKCDDLLPIKKEEPKKANEPGRMGMLTWVVLIVLGAIYLFNQCCRADTAAADFDAGATGTGGSSPHLVHPQ